MSSIPFVRFCYWCCCWWLRTTKLNSSLLLVVVLTIYTCWSEWVVWLASPHFWNYESDWVWTCNGEVVQQPVVPSSSFSLLFLFMVTSFDLLGSKKYKEKKKGKKGSFSRCHLWECELLSFHTIVTVTLYQVCVSHTTQHNITQRRNGEGQTCKKRWKRYIILHKKKRKPIPLILLAKES